MERIGGSILLCHLEYSDVHFQFFHITLTGDWCVDAHTCTAPSFLPPVSIESAKPASALAVSHAFSRPNPVAGRGGAPMMTHHHSQQHHLTWGNSAKQAAPTPQPPAGYIYIPYHQSPLFHSTQDLRSRSSIATYSFLLPCAVIEREREREDEAGER